MPIRKRKQRMVIAAEILLVVLALWLAGARVATLRIPGWAGAAIVLVAAVWIGATAIEVGVFFASSWDDSRDLLVAGVRAGAIAMWFVPAVLLLGMEPAWARLAGLLLAANTTRLLMSRNAPQRLAPAPPPDWTKRYRLLRQDLHQGAAFRTETLPAVVGALAVQGGVCGLIGGYVMPSAGLAVAGSAVWTAMAIRRGAAERRKDRTSGHWLLSVVLTLLLSTLLTAVGFRTEQELNAEEADAGTEETLEKLWRELEHPERKAASQAAKVDRAKAGPASKRVAAIGGSDGDAGGGGSGVTLVPGVIVRPDIRPQRQVVALYMPRSLVQANTKVERTTTFPFTGEYRIFPRSAASKKHGWAVETGTLIENRYATSAGGELETVAEQSIDPPLDFSRCGKVKVLMQNDEEGLFTAALELLTGNDPIALGSEIAGAGWGDEILEFDVPERARLVRGMRLTFHRIQRRDTQSLKIHIRQFTLAPR